MTDSAAWRWDKRGMIFRPHGQHSWMQSHAMLPLAWPLGSGKYRIYFATRDLAGRSHIGSLDWDSEKTPGLIRVAEAPVLSPGSLGFFDDDGVMPSSLVQRGGRLFMYYMGWNSRNRGALFQASIGVAASEDGGLSFQKLSRAPILDRSEHDPCLVGSPWVLYDQERWRMWYVSCFRWEERAGQFQSFYHVKYAESDNGTEWCRTGHVALDLANGETNIARPCVLRDDGGYRMWFPSHAGAGYRIWMAESQDGLDWTRCGGLGKLDVSSSGWDSEAVAYPHVVRTLSGYLMFYCGNGYGKEGFGWAECAAPQ